VLSDITQGRRVWRHQAAGFAAQMVSYAPQREMPRHSHRAANITVILAGSFEEEIDGHDYFTGPLAVVMKPAGSVHATRTGLVGTHSLVIEIDGPLENDLRRRFGLFDECRWFNEPCGLAPCVLDLCRRLRRGDRLTDESMGLCFARIGEAAAAASRAGAGRGRALGVHVRRALELVRRDRRVSTTELAARLGLHPVYLARLFKDRLGCSPMQLRQTLQLGAAVETIIRTEQPLARVAMAAGFSDQSHLTRQVKRHAGLPAGELRRLASGSMNADSDRQSCGSREAE
jgi:AraC family transcriptional regulator